MGSSPRYGVTASEVGVVQMIGEFKDVELYYWKRWHRSEDEYHAIRFLLILLEELGLA